MSSLEPRQSDGPCRVIQAGLAITTALALSTFSTQFANPNEFKWELLGLCNIWILLEVVVTSRRDGLRLAPDRLDLLLLAFLAYAAVSVAWSADADSGKLAVVKWVLLTIPFLYIKHSATPWLMLQLLRSVAVGNGIVMFFAISGWANWGGFGNENFLTEFQLISLPFLIALFRAEAGLAAKALIAVLIGLEVVDLAVFNPSRIEWLVVLGALVFFAERFLWRRYRAVHVLGLNLVGLAALTALGFWLWQQASWPDGFFRESIRPRFALTLNTLRLWLDAPVFGHGAGSFDALYPLYKEWHLQYFEHADKLLGNKMVKAGAAHNEILQFLAEYGVVGIGLLAGLAGQLLTRWLRSGDGDLYAKTGAGAIAVGFIIGMIEFPLQNPATALLLVIGAGFMAGRSPAPAVANLSTVGGKPSLLAPISASVAIALLAAGIFRFDQSNRSFGQVGSMIAVDPQAAFDMNNEAYRLNPWDRRIRMQLYTTLTFWAANSPVPVSSPEENDRTYAVSIRGAEHQPVLMLGRVQHLLNSGRHVQNQAEVEALLTKLKQHSSRMADVWILEAYYALLVEDRDRAAAALTRAQSLDPTPEQRENLQRLRQSL